MWKCKKCKEITKGSIYVSTGFCENCNEHNLLERYDSLNDDEVKKDE